MHGNLNACLPLLISPGLGFHENVLSPHHEILKFLRLLSSELLFEKDTSAGFQGEKPMVNE